MEYEKERPTKTFLASLAVHHNAFPITQDPPWRLHIMDPPPFAITWYIGTSIIAGKPYSPSTLGPGWHCQRVLVEYHDLLELLSL